MIKKIHRVLGLFVAAFWLVQALTGVLLTFRQELDNATLPGRGAPVVTAGLGQRVELIQHAGGRVTSLWVADFAADQSQGDSAYVTDAHRVKTTVAKPRLRVCMPSYLAAPGKIAAPAHVRHSVAK
jgi:uncharacterized iron-regulated membrane protein